jgi:hypothetical protein
VVVVGTDPWVIEEGEQLVPICGQALAQPNAVLVGIVLPPDAVQPLITYPGKLKKVPPKRKFGKEL